MRYREYEQVNGAVANGLMDENEELKRELEGWRKWADMVIEAGGVGEAEDREFERLIGSGRNGM